MSITKRLNFLKLFDILTEFEKEEVEAFLFSIIEHRVSDLGFRIETETVDLKNYMHGPSQEIVKIISDLVETSLLTIPSDYAAEIIVLDRYVYDICLTKEL